GKAFIQHGVALAFGHRLPLLLFDVSKADVFHIFLLILRRHEIQHFSTDARISGADFAATSSRSSGLISGLKSSGSNTCRISISASSLGMGLGQRLTHSIASCNDAHFHSQKPATNSFVSANGPSVTIRFSPANLTRAPFELACSPSAASSKPALVRSSLNFPIAARSCSLGRPPASEDLVALTITMNRIFCLLV